MQETIKLQKLVGKYRAERRKRQIIIVELGHDNEFLDLMQKAQSMKENTDELDCICSKCEKISYRF